MPGYTFYARAVSQSTNKIERRKRRDYQPNGEMRCNTPTCEDHPERRRRRRNNKQHRKSGASLFPSTSLARVTSLLLYRHPGATRVHTSGQCTQTKAARTCRRSLALVVCAPLKIMTLAPSRPPPPPPHPLPRHVKHCLSFLHVFFTIIRASLCLLLCSTAPCKAVSSGSES
jgi:hypothetical protein